MSLALEVMINLCFQRSIVVNHELAELNEFSTDHTSDS
jgi:hypothetical protein